MKKQWFKMLSYLMPTEKNIIKNKHSILALLFNSEYQRLSTQEAIDLFKEVESEFYNELSKRNLDAEIELETISKFLKNQLK